MRHHDGISGAAGMRTGVPGHVGPQSCPAHWGVTRGLRGVVFLQVMELDKDPWRVQQPAKD